eukprot:CAMPEP_0182428684 /NCGR_PEP_ID=MMETSP1167-20130531/23208_1 /TAXON_ID=2988 /ORGANISM="Mallomonas Sp, Strain CCMP3275" /LENGTH=175 /DNA_ID=CAMNT_0024611713 /DNA_START=62 /DNA_END=589 /DNA_ORIENTATION=+
MAFRPPRLVVFDLDYTLWRPELYMMSGSPYRKDAQGRILDRRGTEISLFPGVEDILREVKSWGSSTQLGVASRTDEVKWAAEVLDLMTLDGVPLSNLFDYKEIYPTSKTRHFRKLQKDSGIPYSEMIFFDDWDLNCDEVSQLGVMCIHCPSGLNIRAWKNGMRQWNNAYVSSEEI